MAKFGEFTESTLELVPSFAPGVETSRSAESYVQVKVPHPKTLLYKFLCFIFKVPDYRIITLDETGSEIAGLIDGRRTFRALSAHLAVSRSLEEGQARESMAAFLRRLSYDRAIVLSRPHAGDGAEGSGV